MAGQDCAGHVTGDLPAGASSAGECSSTLNLWIAGFAVAQLLLSQLRDIHALWYALDAEPNFMGYLALLGLRVQPLLG